MLNPSSPSSPRRSTSSSQSQTSLSNQQTTGNTAEGSVYFQQSAIESQNNSNSQQDMSATTKSSICHQHMPNEIQDRQITDSLEEKDITGQENSIFFKLPMEIRDKILIDTIIKSSYFNIKEMWTIKLDCVCKNWNEIIKSHTHLPNLIKLKKLVYDITTLETLEGGCDFDRLRYKISQLSLNGELDDILNEDKELILTNLINLINRTCSYEDAKKLLDGNFGDRIRNNSILMCIIDTKKVAYGEAANLAVGGNINTPDEIGDPPLTKAILHGNLDLVVELEKREPGLVNTQQYDTGWRAIHEASRCGHIEILEFLCEKTADIDIRDNAGNTALHIAAEYKCFGAVVRLVRKKANVNKQNNTRSTPLHTALRLTPTDSSYKIIKFLIENGADTNLQNSHGQTALDLAIENNCTEIAEYLMQRMNQANTSMG